MDVDDGWMGGDDGWMGGDLMMMMDGRTEWGGGPDVREG